MPALPTLIDHTCLTDETPERIAALCREAREYGFCAVCVRPAYIPQAKALLVDSAVRVATVIGFPACKTPLDAEGQHPSIGAVPLAEKLREIQDALAHGVDELDVVMNVPQFKANPEDTRREFAALQAAAGTCPIKLIIETDLLDDAEIIAATRLCVEAGFWMVKTCTGMIQGGAGATPAIIARIRETIGAAPTQIKASGGIRTRAQLQALVEAGAHRIGASAGVAIVQARSVAPS